MVVLDQGVGAPKVVLDQGVSPLQYWRADLDWLGTSKTETYTR
jgi:hypothetical protein